MIHPADVRPMNQQEAAITLGFTPDAFGKQVKANEWEGAYFTIGSQKYFTLALILECQKAKALEAAT